MFKASFAISSVLFATALSSTAALAHGDTGAQVCTLGAAAAGQPAAVVCKSTATGATTQTVPVGNLVASAGGSGGALSRRGDDVLVADQAGGATLLQEAGGRLVRPVTLSTDGEASLSGALGAHGAYVLTGTRVLFFPHGRATASSSAKLLVGDGSAAQVTLAGGYAYVSEKAGSLEAFPLRADGNLEGAGAPVAGIPAGVIVGITGVDDLVVSPVAHLATNANMSTIPVSNGATEIQDVPTKEVAACWTATGDDGEVCVTNPGSMTVSCGHVGAGGFTSYTSAAASPTGESVFDLDLRGEHVGILGKASGAFVLMVYARAEQGSDFLESMRQIPVGTAAASGALLLPAIGR